VLFTSCEMLYTCYIAPHKHNHANIKSSNPPPFKRYKVKEEFLLHKILVITNKHLLNFRSHSALSSVVNKTQLLVFTANGWMWRRQNYYLLLGQSAIEWTNLACIAWKAKISIIKMNKMCAFFKSMGRQVCLFQLCVFKINSCNQFH